MDHPELLQIIPTVSRSPVPFCGPSKGLQLIPIVSRSPVPFYGPSIAFTDHSYCLQVTCTFLWTIHSFYRSFLSSPGHLYSLQTNHSFDRSFLWLQVTCTVIQTIHSFYRSFLSSPGHLYCFTDHP